MSKNKKRNEIEKAKQFAELLASNEESMGEHAAYHVTCEMMDVDPDDGYDLLMLADNTMSLEENSEVEHV